MNKPIKLSKSEQELFDYAWPYYKALLPNAIQSVLEEARDECRGIIHELYLAAIREQADADANLKPLPDGYSEHYRLGYGLYRDAILKAKGELK